MPPAGAPISLLARHRLVEGHRHMRLVHAAQVEARLQRGGHDGLGARARLDADRVEEGLVRQPEAAGLRRAGERARLQRHAPRDARKALRPVPHRVHGGHHRQQHLRGADVGGGLLAADVLLARLQRKPHGGRARRIHRDADEPAGQAALQRVLHRDEAGMRPAIAERDAEALRGAHHDVRPHLAGRRHQGQRQQVRRDDGERAGGMGGGDLGRDVAQLARRAGILRQHREGLLGGDGGGKRRRLRHHDADAHRLGAHAHHRDALRVQVGRHHQHIALRPVGRVRERDGLRRRRALVEQRGAGHRQARQVADHGLEVDQRLKPPLRDLRLIGRVGRVPAGILEDVAQDHRRRVRAVIAHADQAALPDVALRQRAQLRDGGGLVHRRGQGGEVHAADGGGHRPRHQLLQVAAAHGLEHLGDLGLGGADVAADELALVLQGKQLLGEGHARVSRKAA
jgi:hypothetical protein